MTLGQGSPGQNSEIHEKYGSGYKNEHILLCMHVPARLTFQHTTSKAQHADTPRAHLFSIKGG